MTYIRNPRDPLMWESDGVWNGKYMAIDGTTHPTPEEALAKDKQIDALAEGQQSGKLVEKTSRDTEGESSRPPRGGQHES